MTRQELRVFLGRWFCGCGSPDIAAGRLRDLLALHPLYDHRAELTALIPDEGTQYLLLYMLKHLGLTEHGVSITGAWLTARGQAVYTALINEASDGFQTLTESSCVHGYIDTEECPACQ